MFVCFSFCFRFVFSFVFCSEFSILFVMFLVNLPNTGKGFFVASFQLSSVEQIHLQERKTLVNFNLCFHEFILAKTLLLDDGFLVAVFVFVFVFFAAVLIKILLFDFTNRNENDIVIAFLENAIELPYLQHRDISKDFLHEMS